MLLGLRTLVLQLTVLYHGLVPWLGSPVLFMSVAGIVTNVIEMIFSPVSVLAVMVGFSPNGGGSNFTTLGF